ncbi:MAG: gluconate 2-dehydrogenase subunit 3 family protein [Actinobacteria bacterium]|nr:gluconate 2-dehydrogenase subunit 3 family protein [Actinomycetota bacterium]
MPEPGSIKTIRAAVEAVVPPTDGAPGAVELGVVDHVVENMELYLPGFVDLVAALLDAYAAGVRPGAAFAELDPAERDRVFREMGAEESQDLREALGAVLVFTLGGVYSEWTGYDRATGHLRPPAAWGAMGFPGPAPAHSSYRGDG